MGKLIKWYLIAALVGLTPVLIRAFFYLILNDRSSFQLFTVGDVITWGLVLNISIFNDRDRYFSLNPVIGNTAAAFSVGLIIAFVVVYVAVLISELFPSLFNKKTLFEMSTILALGSFIVGFIFIIFCSPPEDSTQVETV